MKNKKGVELALNTMVTAIIVIIVVVVVIATFSGLFRKESGVIGGQVNRLDVCDDTQDFDSDGLINKADPCRCIPQTEKNDCTSANQWEGCPPNNCKK